MTPVCESTITYWDVNEVKPVSRDWYITIDDMGDITVAYWDGAIFRRNEWEESGEEPAMYWAALKAPEEILSEINHRMIDARLHDPAPEDSPRWEREYQGLYNED